MLTREVAIERLMCDVRTSDNSLNNYGYGIDSDLTK